MVASTQPVQHDELVTHAQALLTLRIVVMVLAVVEVGMAGEAGVAAWLWVVTGVFAVLPVMVWRRIAPVVFRRPMVVVVDVTLALAVQVLVPTAEVWAVAYVALTLSVLTLVYPMPQVLVFVVPLIAVGLIPADEYFTVLQALTATVIVTAGAWYGVATRRMLVDLAEARQATTTATAALTRSDERLRIAREMHDSVDKTLVGIRLVATGLAGRSDLPADARKVVSDIADAADMGNVQSRRMIQDLRAAGTDLQAELEELLAPAGGTADVSADIDVSALDVLRPDARHEVTRFLQEAVRNVVRHAQATSLQVRATAVDDAVQVRVVDDGVGFDPDQVAPGHHGLAGLRERATTLDARLRIDTAPGHGCTIQLVVPVAQEAMA